MVTLEVVHGRFVVDNATVASMDMETPDAVGYEHLTKPGDGVRKTD